MKASKVGRLLSPSVSGGNENEKEVYFIGRGYPYICRWDREANQISPLVRIPEHSSVYTWPLLLRYKNTLCCFLEPKSRILFFDLVTGRFDSLEFCKDYLNGCAYWAVSSCHFRYNICYLVSVWNEKIFLLDMETKRLESIDIPYLRGQKNCVYTSCFDKKRYIYIAQTTAPGIISFDTQTKVFKRYQIKCGLSGFGSICFDGECCWMSGVEPAIVKWNPATGQVDVRKDFLETMEVFRIEGKDGTIKWEKCGSMLSSKNPLFNDSYFDDYTESLFFIPFHSNGILCMDKREECMKFIPITEKEKYDLQLRIQTMPSYNICFSDKGSFWLCSENEGEFFRIDCIGKKAEKIHLDIADKDIQVIAKDLVESGDIINEYDVLNLEDYLKFDFSATSKAEYTAIGKKIYENT